MSKSSRRVFYIVEHLFLHVQVPNSHLHDVLLTELTLNCIYRGYDLLSDVLLALTCHFNTHFKSLSLNQRELNLHKLVWKCKYMKQVIVKTLFKFHHGYFVLKRQHFNPSTCIQQILHLTVPVFQLRWCILYYISYRLLRWKPLDNLISDIIMSDRHRVDHHVDLKRDMIEHITLKSHNLFPSA